jgi:hypothetical protein
VLLDFTDTTQRHHLIELHFDLSASPVLNDPALLAARLAEEYRLTESQQASLQDSICDQLHSYALYTLSCQGKAVGASQIQASGVMLPAHAALGQVAAISAAAYTGAALSVPPQALTTSLLAMAGVVIPPAPPPALHTGAHFQSSAVPPPVVVPSGTHGGYRPRNTGPGESAYMINKKRRLLQQQQQQQQQKQATAAAKVEDGRSKAAAKGPADDADDDLGDAALAGDDGNVDYCDMCDDAGDLVCCDRCPRSFHMTCLKVKELPDGEWRCPECERTFGRHGEHETAAGSATGPVVTALYHGPFSAPAARCTTVRDERARPSPRCCAAAVVGPPPPPFTLGAGTG